MKKTCALLATFCLINLAKGEELLDATDFSKGKGGWQGPGTVVFLAPDGTVQSLPSSSTTPVLRVKLNKNRWSVLEHRVKLDKDQTSASFKIELQTSPDYSPLSSSKEYASEDFKEGGEYGWSARIFTKAGFLLQLSESGGWQYRPLALKAASGWTSLLSNFGSLKSKKNETLALCFPPGEGSVDIKSVSLDAK